MSLGIKCFNCSGDTITRIMQSSGLRWPPHGETTRGLLSRNDSPLAACQKCFVSRSQPHYLFINSILHIHLSMSIHFHKCRQIPSNWPQNKLNNFQSIHLMLKIFYLHIYTSNHKYYPCSRSLMHAYHLFLPLYK